MKVRKIPSASSVVSPPVISACAGVISSSATSRVFSPDKMKESLIVSLLPKIKETYLADAVKSYILLLLPTIRHCPAHA